MLCLPAEAVVVRLAYSDKIAVRESDADDSITALSFLQESNNTTITSIEVIFFNIVRKLGVTKTSKGLFSIAGIYNGFYYYWFSTKININRWVIAFAEIHTKCAGIFPELFQIFGSKPATILSHGM